jgi:hypothetical protein
MPKQRGPGLELELEPNKHTGAFVMLGSAMKDFQKKAKFQAFNKIYRVNSIICTARMNIYSSSLKG